ASGGARFSGSAWGLTAQDATVDGAFVLANEGGAVTIRPVRDGEPARLQAAAFETETARIEGLAASFVPVIDAVSGAWSVTPGDAPVLLAADAIRTASMRLSDVALEAPQGGLGMEGRGGVFALQDGAAPV